MLKRAGAEKSLHPGEVKCLGVSSVSTPPLLGRTSVDAFTTVYTESDQVKTDLLGLR